MVSGAKAGNSTMANSKEIIIATPESPSIVSTGHDVPDGNTLSGKSSVLANTAASKNETKIKSKTTDKAEIVEVHHSPSKSVDESSSTGSSTWSVKMSPIKKRFSLSNKAKRGTPVVVSTPNVLTEAEARNDKDKNEKEIDEVFHAIRVSWSHIVFCTMHCLHIMFCFVLQG